MMEEVVYSEKEKENLTGTQQEWDKFSFTYYGSLNSSSMGLMCNLMALTRASKKYSIIDAGCGPGLSTKLVASMMPNKDSVIYALDFSKEMIHLSQKVFEDYQDFNANKDNHWEVSEYQSSQRVKLEEDLTKIRNRKIGKIVKFFQGRIETLPFADEQFDVYLSNLSLHLCEDPNKIIKEAYRVLKPNGVAAFSVWGKSQESKLVWKIFSDVFSIHNVDISKVKDSFALGEDMELLKEKFTNSGFKDVRLEYTTEIFDCYDEQDFLVKFQGPRVNSILRSVKYDKTVKNILEDVKIKANKHIVKEKQMVTLSVLIVVAFKNYN